MKQRFVAQPEDAGRRLDVVLAERLPGRSRSQVARLIDDGRVSLDGKVAAASRRLAEGQAFEVDIPPPEPSAIEPLAMPLAILHEDADIVVIDKPAGIAVHPGAGQVSATLVHGLLHHCGESLLGIGGERRPGIVHRLDKGTTGVLVVAKTGEAHAALAAQFAARTVRKTYAAIVHGVIDPEGRVEAPIGRSPTRRSRMAAGHGRPSLSLWRRLEVFGRSASRIEIDLRTGRTHQARVHLAHVGHPIVGDAAYGDRRVAPDPWARRALRSSPRPALHALRLEIEHPTLGRRLAFEAPLPADMSALIARLGAAAAGPGP